MRLGFKVANVDAGCGIMLGGITRGLTELGHQVVPWTLGVSCDHVLVFNVSSHINHYNWDDIEQLEGCKFAFIDTAEYGWWTHYDYHKDMYYSAFAPLAIKAKPPVQLKLLEFLKGKSYPYFLREMYKGFDYPENYHPIDYPLYYHSRSDIQPTTFEEYKNRNWDVYIAWGHSHQTRVHITEMIKKLPFKIFAFCDSNAKLNQFEYFKGLQNAKISVSYDGYGSGSFRETEVLSRCVLFRNVQCVRRPNPLTNGVNFVEYTVEEKLGDDKYPIYVNTDVGELITQHLSNLENLYNIYREGYKHCTEWLSEKGMAQYILETTQKHDWTVVTK